MIGGSKRKVLSVVKGAESDGLQKEEFEGVTRRGMAIGALSRRKKLPRAHCAELVALRRNALAARTRIEIRSTRAAHLQRAQR